LPENGSNQGRNLAVTVLYVQVSAKTGDSVNSTFYRIASDLCGITLTRPEVLLLHSRYRS